MIAVESTIDHSGPAVLEGATGLLTGYWVGGSCPRHFSFDLSEPHSDRDHSLKLREVSKVFAAGLTATIQKMCKVY